MKSYERIEINPDVMFGKPVLKGARTTLEQILHEHTDGMTINEILKDHPHLTVDDIHAAQPFAADYLENDEVIYSKAAS